MTKDEKYISRCLQLAYNGLCNTAPNPVSYTHLTLPTIA